MIALRGGYDSVKQNEMLNRLLYWIDEIRAARRDTLLSLPAFAPKMSILREHKHVELDHSPLPPLDPNVLDPTSPDFLSAIETQLDALTTHLHLHTRNLLSNTNRMLLADRFTTLERDLLAFIHTLNVSLTAHDFRTTETEAAAVQDLISAISLLLRTQIPLRGVVPSSLVLAHHGRRLYELLSLSSIQTETQRDVQADALTLTLGALSCYPMQSGALREKEWFMDQLVQLLSSRFAPSPPPSVHLSASSSRSSQSPPRSQRRRTSPQRQGQARLSAERDTAISGPKRSVDWIEMRILRAHIRHHFELGTGIDVLVDRIWDEVLRRLATISM